MINIPEGGGWFGDVIRVFRLNQKKRWMRLIFVFLFLEESVWGRAERVVVFCFQKYIYFWELYVSGNYKRLDLTS